MMPFRPKLPIYVLPHGIQVIGEYAPDGGNRYWRVRIRPHEFFPGVRIVSNGMYVHRSRAILASKLGRALTPSEHAHHEDEVRDNDIPGNIELLSAAEHNRHHKTGSKHREDSKQKTSATLKRLYLTGEKIPVPVIGSKHWNAKLNEEQAAIIKHSKEKTGVLVRRYNVSRTVIKGIRRNIYWRHVA